MSFVFDNIIFLECTSALSSFLTNLNGSLNVFIYCLKHRRFLVGLCQGESSEDHYRHTARSCQQTPSPAATNHSTVCHTTSNHFNLCTGVTNHSNQTSGSANQNRLCHSATNQSSLYNEVTIQSSCCHAASTQNNVITFTIRENTYLVTSV